MAEQDPGKEADTRAAAAMLPGIALRAALVAVFALALGHMAQLRHWTTAGWLGFAVSGLAALGSCAATALALPHLEDKLSRATAWIAAAIGLASLAVLVSQIL